MSKEQKTAGELEALIHEHTQNWETHSLKVKPLRQMGWGAFVVASRSRLGAELQDRVADIAQELRAQYDLKE